MSEPYIVRAWSAEDVPAIVACHRDSYPDYPDSSQYDERKYRLQFQAFPVGQFLVELEGRVIAYATSLIVQIDDESVRYTYGEITGDGTFSSHDPAGDTLYGADIAVLPEYRGQGIAQLLYDKRCELLRRYNLRRMVAYGRLTGFPDHAGAMTAEEYVEKVEAGQLKDRALTAHLKAGYRVKRVLLDLMSDRSSLDHATLLELTNPDFEPTKRLIAARPLRRMVRRVRVCAAQYLFRTIQTWEDMEVTVRFFVDTADTYHCHFLLFPEMFTAQLLQTMPRDLTTLEEMRRLAALSDRYIELFRGLAAEHQLHIIGGSHPIERDGALYNVAHLFTPSGNVYTQDKLHITPAERRTWGIQPGHALRVFDTALARIAIPICYDIEFPESIRLLARAGVEVFFVPFSTDDRKAYHRVRFTAQARAVENMTYCVLAGNVGNLPSRSYLINYGSACILTPSDYGFPPGAVAAEVEPNLETVAIADLDIDALQLQREMGSVRPFFDLRPDLYELRSKRKVEVIRVE